MEGMRHRTDLIERDDQLDEFDRLLADAIRHTAGIAAVSGPVAGGKTELLHAFAEHAAARGAVVLTATGYCSEVDALLGVITQLLRHPAVESGARSILDAGRHPPAAEPCEGDAVPFTTVTAEIGRRVWELLRDLSVRAPVVLIIDDVHFADAASLRTLASLAERLRACRVVMVVAEPGRPGRPDSPIGSWRAALLRHPRLARIPVPPLSVQGTGRLLAGETGPAPDQPEAWHRLSGGNPLLLRALVADRRAAGGRSPEPVAGEEYANAVATCVRRTGSGSRTVARALAALGDYRSPLILRQLVERPEQIPDAMTELTTAGLLDGDRFRHPAARQAVLQAIPVDARQTLHRRAAELLHGAGAEASAVAAHLVAAGRATEPWAFATLLTAAREVMRHDDLTGADACLRLADESATDEQQRLAVALVRNHVEFRTDPGTASRWLRPMVAALREDRLPAASGVTLLRRLLWHGSEPEITMVLRHVEERRGSLDPAAAAEFEVTRALLGTSHPMLSPGAPDPAATAPGVRAASLLGRVLRHGADDESLATAELVLQSTPLGDDTYGVIQAALYILIYADRCDLAVRWCDALRRQADERLVPAWQSIFAATRAEIALRQGDVRTSADRAREALTLVTPRSWGVSIGAPLACLLLSDAATGSGRRDVSAVPAPDPAVPDLMWRTRFGAQYRYARGRHRLLHGWPHGALEDLNRCGEQLRAWEIDLPAFLPWRADAVEALCALGRRDEATALAVEQLSRPSADQPRTRGIALRALAATTRPQHRRRSLLREAADLLEHAGDRFELARTLADLGEAQNRAGHYSGARLVHEQAAAIAAEQGLTPLHSRVAERPADPTSGVLSGAELEVAQLAASGRSNREIAHRLFITVSTVEQHLTRAYRKLRIAGRAELPGSLGRTA